MTGCTGTPARNAPVLNGSRDVPLLVVPWEEGRERTSIKRAPQGSPSAAVRWLIPAWAAAVLHDNRKPPASPLKFWKNINRP
jgi:hypothetical protein